MVFTVVSMYSNHMAYREGFRLKVIEYLAAGHTQMEACVAFNISWATVSKWRKKYKETREVKDKPPLRVHRRPSKLNLEELKEYAGTHPNATLKEMGEVLGCSDTTVLRGLSTLGISYRKRLKLHPDDFIFYTETHPYASHKEIGRAFGCAAGTVSRAFKRYGLPQGKRGKKPDIEELKKYIEAHPQTSYREITRVFGYSEPTIRRMFRRLGLTYDFSKRSWIFEKQPSDESNAKNS